MKMDFVAGDGILLGGFRDIPSNGHIHGVQRGGVAPHCWHGSLGCLLCNIRSAGST